MLPQKRGRTDPLTENSEERKDQRSSLMSMIIGDAYFVRSTVNYQKFKIIFDLRIFMSIFFSLICTLVPLAH